MSPTQVNILFLSLILHDLGADDVVAMVDRAAPVGPKIQVDHRDVTQDSHAVGERIVDAVKQLQVAAIE